MVSIVQKKRLNLRRMEVFLDAERAEEHPRVFTKINVKLYLRAKDLKKPLPDAVRLSIYCSVAGMLSKLRP